MKEKHSIAILYICTGKYVYFWEEFYKSFEERFLKKSEVEYFVFTDASSLYGEKDNNKIHKIFQENLGWPGNTLYRFKMFNSISEQLEKFDFCFFFNANIICVENISEQEFLPSKNELLLVQHPGYYKTNVFKLPYERNRNSKAYIPWGKGKTYVYGAMNGGYSQTFLEMIRILEKNVDEDMNNGIIARWHDESHLNWYVSRNVSYRLLNPSYAHPEGVKLPFKEKIKVLDKAKKIELDIDKILELEQKSILKRIKRSAYNIWNRRRCK